MKPTSVILDLLRTYLQKGTTVKAIMATGAMYDFSENQMRVNLSRLVSKGIVENFKRGYYRLTDHTDPLNDFVESWRLGEARVKPWDGQSWLLTHTEEKPVEKRSWALDACGFRQIADGLWIRPDNLARDPVDLERLLTALGMDDTCILATGASLTQRWQDAWEAHFDFCAMAGRYEQYRADLEASLTRLDDMPYESALKESFQLGGRVVHILAKDPLLPEAFIDTASRKALWQSMLAYDRKGREVWGRRGRDRPSAMPTPQLSVLETSSAGTGK